jgi:hypothetical protein
MDLLTTRETLAVAASFKLNAKVTTREKNAMVHAHKRCNISFHVISRRVRAQVRSYGIYGGQSSIGTGFLRVLQFPLPINIPQTAPHADHSGCAV